MIYGILSISNGVGLKYPFLPVIANLSKLCDTVLVGLDPKHPQDFEAVKNFIDSGLPNVHVIEAAWNRENIDAGSEIAIQMDSLVNVAKLEGATWVVVPQADEMFLDADFDMLKLFMKRAAPDTIGFSTERLYFWGGFDKIRKDWNATLVRIFRAGAFSFLADGTDKAGMYAGSLVPGNVVALPYKMYHYSRVGSAQEISNRVRNLDGLFHPAETLVAPEAVPEYDFKTRSFDNYAVTGLPPEIEGEVVEFTGNHPSGIKEWFGV